MAQRKETKTKIKVRDLKPRKDAKGGVRGPFVNQNVNQNFNQNFNQKSPTAGN
jgi:hypothetical protein